MIRSLAKTIKAESGLTLVEIMITVFVLSVGVLSSLLYFSTVSASNELARDVTTATTHAEYVLEEMRLRPTLTNIVNTNWVAWTAAEGINTLNGESINVSYVDNSAVPLVVTTTVNWSSRSGSKVVNLTTEFTK